MPYFYEYLFSYYPIYFFDIIIIRNAVDNGWLVLRATTKFNKVCTVAKMTEYEEIDDTDTDNVDTNSSKNEINIQRDTEQINDDL